MIKHFPIILAALFLAVLLGMFFFLSPFIIPAYRADGQIWRGYYTVLVKSDSNYRDKLAKAGWKVIVSDTTETTLISSFDGLKETGIKDLASGFDPQDPRLDPHVLALDRYFEGGDGWKRVFVPSGLAEVTFFLKLLREYPGFGREWKLADMNILGKVMMTLLSVIFLMWFLCFGKSHWLWTIIAYLPWLLRIITGDFHDLVSFILLFSAWFLIFKDGREYLAQYLLFGWKDPSMRKLQEKLLYIGAAVLFSSIIRIPMDNPFRELAAHFFPLLADICLLVIYGLWRVFRCYQLNHHPVFEPVLITKRRRRDEKGKLFVWLLIFPIIAAPFLSQIRAAPSGLLIPAPSGLNGSSVFNRKTLEALWQETGNDELPNIATYVAHIFYQEGLVYGQTYAFPEQDRVLMMSVFTEDAFENRIIKSSRQVFKYDEPWLQEVLAVPAEGSIPRMLLDQRKPVSVKLDPWKSLHKQFVWWKGLILILFSGFILFFFDFFYVPVISYHRKFQVDRRNRKAA